MTFSPPCWKSSMWRKRLPRHVRPPNETRRFELPIKSASVSSSFTSPEAIYRAVYGAPHVPSRRCGVHACAHRIHKLSHIGRLADISDLRQDGILSKYRAIRSTCEHEGHAESTQLQRNRRDPLTAKIDIEDGGIGFVSRSRSRARSTELAGPSTSKPAFVNADLISRAMKNSSSTTRTLRELTWDPSFSFVKLIPGS